MEDVWAPLIDDLKSLDRYTPTGYFHVPSNTFNVSTKVKPQWIKGVTRFEGNFNPNALPTATIQNPTPFGYLSKVAFQNLDPINYNDIPRSGNMPQLVATAGGTNSGEVVDAPPSSGPFAPATSGGEGPGPESHPMHEMWKNGAGSGGAAGGAGGGPASMNSGPAVDVWTGNNLAGIDPKSIGAINDAEKAGPGSDGIALLRGTAAGLSGKINESSWSHHAMLTAGGGAVRNNFTPHEGILHQMAIHDSTFLGQFQEFQRRGQYKNRTPYLRDVGNAKITGNKFDTVVERPKEGAARTPARQGGMQAAMGKNYIQRRNALRRGGG